LDTRDWVAKEREHLISMAQTEKEKAEARQVTALGKNAFE